MFLDNGSGLSEGSHGGGAKRRRPTSEINWDKSSHFSEADPVWAGKTFRKSQAHWT